jgi:hypothetical protein
MLEFPEVTEKTGHEDAIDGFFGGGRLPRRGVRHGRGGPRDIWTDHELPVDAPADELSPGDPDAEPDITPDGPDAEDLAPEDARSVYWHPQCIDLGGRAAGAALSTSRRRWIMIPPVRSGNDPGGRHGPFS